MAHETSPEEMPLLPPLHRSWADPEMAGYVLACILAEDAADMQVSLLEAGYSEQETNEALFSAYLATAINAMGHSFDAEQVAQAMERSAARVRSGESRTKALALQGRIRAAVAAEEGK